MTEFLIFTAIYAILLQFHEKFENIKITIIFIIIFILVGIFLKYWTTFNYRGLIFPLSYLILVNPIKYLIFKINNKKPRLYMFADYIEKPTIYDNLFTIFIFIIPLIITLVFLFYVK